MGRPLAKGEWRQEVKPHLAGICVDESEQDAKDGNVGIVGYEISFYHDFPPRPLEDIEAEIIRVFTETTACASFP